MTYKADGIGWALPSDESVSWSSTTTASGAKDVGISRTGAGVLIVDDGSTGRGQMDYDRTATSGITASTTQTQGQGPLITEINEVSVVANVNDTVTLPTASPGRRCVVINNGANTLQIFPASGDDLGAGVDTATTLATGSVLRLDAYDATNWV